MKPEGAPKLEQMKIQHRAKYQECRQHAGQGQKNRPLETLMAGKQHERCRKESGSWSSGHPQEHEKETEEHRDSPLPAAFDQEKSRHGQAHSQRLGTEAKRQKSAGHAQRNKPLNPAWRIVPAQPPDRRDRGYEINQYWKSGHGGCVYAKDLEPPRERISVHRR